jgi:LysM repeat protein
MLDFTSRLMNFRINDPLGGNGGSRVDRFIAAAMKFEGQPYKYGGGHTSDTFSKPGPVDCSGLVTQAARMAGLNFDGTAATQQDKGRSVSMNDLQPGDLLFHGNPASHVGIYIGNGKAIHAPKTGDVVKVVDVKDYGYFDNARRLFDAADRATADAPETEKPEKPRAERPADRFERTAMAPAPAPAPGPSYVPQAGETLLAVAQKTLGDANRWQEIYALNQHLMPSPYVLFPGQPITLPAGAVVEPAAVAAPAPIQVAALAPTTTGAVGTFQNVQNVLNATKDRMGRILSGMAMA